MFIPVLFLPKRNTAINIMNLFLIVYFLFIFRRCPRPHIIERLDRCFSTSGVLALRGSRGRYEGHMNTTEMSELISFN